MKTVFRENYTVKKNVIFYFTKQQSLRKKLRCIKMLFSALQKQRKNRLTLSTFCFHIYRTGVSHGNEFVDTSPSNDKKNFETDSRYLFSPALGRGLQKLTTEVPNSADQAKNMPALQVCKISNTSCIQTPPTSTDEKKRGISPLWQR